MGSTTVRDNCRGRALVTARPAGGGLSQLWTTLFSICGGADPTPGQTHSEWVQQATWALPEATEGLGQRRTSTAPSSHYLLGQTLDTLAIS